MGAGGGAVLTFGSLFSGIGGLDLGLERAGWRCAFQVECDDYCQQVLRAHWPMVRRYRHIEDVDWSLVEPVAMLCGGFPCQDIARVGRRAGIDGPKSGLWTEYLRAVCMLRPQYVLVENTTSLLVRGIERVAGDLAAVGYDAEWDCLPAAAFGAPHIRDRLYLLAYPRGGRYASPDQTVFAGWSSSQLHAGWTPEPGVGRVADGLPRQVDRLRALGNAVVPAVAEWIGRRVLEVAR